MAQELEKRIEEVARSTTEDKDKREETLTGLEKRLRETRLLWAETGRKWQETARGPLSETQC